MLINLSFDLILRQIRSALGVCRAQSQTKFQRFAGIQVEEQPVVVRDYEVDCLTGWQYDRQFFQRQRARRLARRNRKELQVPGDPERLEIGDGSAGGDMPHVSPE